MNATSQSSITQKRSKISVYFLAAPEEEDECLAIRKHLSPAIRNSKIPIEINSDFDIPAGEDKAKYKLKLLESDIVLALISSDYISDDETYERTQKVIARYNNDETILIPILVRNCLWKSTPFVNLPLLPKNFQPLNNKQFWNSEDDALMAVVEDIYEAINEFGSEETIEPAPVVEIKKIVEPKTETESAEIDQVKLIDEPEQLINGTEIDVEDEGQGAEINADVLSENLFVEPAQQVINEQDLERSTQPKKQKIGAPIQVDWRKHYYRKVLWKRFFAFILDHLMMIPVSFAIVFIGIVIVFLFKGETATDLNNFEVVLVVLIGFIAYLLINAKMESSKWRGTLGKRLLKLQITDKQGHPITFSRAFVRNVLRTVVGYFFLLLVPYLIQRARFKKTKKLFHDELSNTVIGERLSS
jgi:uncharacterized RDD family membrane protein YckC